MSRAVAIAQASGMILATCVTGVLAKLALREVAPFTFVWLQIAIGGALLTLYTFGLRRLTLPAGLGRELWLYIAWIGLANLAIVRVLFTLGLERLPATTYVYLTNFVGVVTMLMSVVLLRERPAVLQVCGAIAAIGGLRLFFPDLPPPAEMLGVAFVAIGVLALASTNNIARKLALVAEGRVSTSVVSTVALWIGGGPVVAWGLLTDWPPAVSGWANWTIIALNGAVAIAFGLTIWNHVLRALRSYEASILASTSVIYTALLAVPTLGEELALHQIGGIALMLLGVCLAQLRRV